MQAATYIKDLRERVEKLKQRRDDCYAKIQQGPGSCSQSQDKQDVRVQFNGAADFDVNLTMSSEKCVELYKVIQTIEQDRCIEIVEASSCLVEDGKTTHTIKCRVCMIHLQQTCRHPVRLLISFRSMTSSSLCIICRQEALRLSWMHPWWQQDSKGCWRHHLQNLKVLGSKLVKY